MAAQAQTRKGDRMRAIPAALSFCACLAKRDDEITCSTGPGHASGCAHSDTACWVIGFCRRARVARICVIRRRHKDSCASATMAGTPIRRCNLGSMISRAARGSAAHSLMASGSMMSIGIPRMATIAFASTVIGSSCPTMRLSPSRIDTVQRLCGRT